MPEKRFKLKGAIVKIYDNNRIIFDVAYREYPDAKYLMEKLTGIVEKLNDLHEEVGMLRDGLDAYENAIPYVCTCEQVRSIHSELFEFTMQQMNFYKEHPNCVKIVIDGERQ